MKLQLRVLILLVLSSVQFISWAKPIDVSQGDNGYQNITSSLVFLDHSNEITINELDDSLFRSDPNIVVTNNIDATYWYRVEVVNTSIEKKCMVFRI